MTGGDAISHAVQQTLKLKHFAAQSGDTWQITVGALRHLICRLPTRVLLMKAYELQIEGLAEAVAACLLTPDHRALVARLRYHPDLANTVLVTTRGDHEEEEIYLGQRGVFDASGQRVHDDHAAWLQAEVTADGGDVRATFARLKDEHWRLSRCDVVQLYLVHDRGGDDPANFVQIEVNVETERLDVAAFSGYDFGGPRDIHQLMELCEGDRLPPEQRRLLAPAVYRLQRIVDVPRFVKVTADLEDVRRELLRERRYKVTPDGGAAKLKTHAELDPLFDRYPPPDRRVFDDWRNSSAGRSGARFCHHWALQLADWTNPKTGVRDAQLIPLWVHGYWLPKIDASEGNVYSFYGRLQALDEQVGHAFAWFFYMLHGNRLDADSGHRVLRAAEDGLIVLPETDYQVLRAWRDRPYGF